MRTYVYIDGFNLYYRALRKTPYKWLDLKKLLTKLLQPHNQIVSIKYFTAVVSGAFDPKQPNRQKTYIRALEKFIPEVEVYYGHFLSHSTRMPRSPLTKPPRMVDVFKTEEKGSDVNLAVHLLNDAWRDVYDCAVVISNDSDLAESMKLVRYQNKKIIGLISPIVDKKGHPSIELTKYAHFVKRIRKGVLRDSQLPSSIPDSNIKKPKIW